MQGKTRSLRYCRFLASFALSGLTILGFMGASNTAGVTPVPPPVGTATTSTGLAGTSNASNSGPKNLGVTPVIPSASNQASGLNSSPSTSAGTFPNDITRFSQSNALPNPTATPTPMNPHQNQGIVPFGNPNPNPAANPQYLQ